MDYRSSQNMLIVAWLLFGIATVFVTLRLYVRLQTRPRLFGNDDRFLVLSLAFFLIQLAILTDLMHMTHNGTYYLPRQIKKACIEAWLLHLCYAQIIWSAKLSLFLLYRRLLSGLCMQKQLRGAAVFLCVSWMFVTVLYAIPLIGFTAGDPRDRTRFTEPQHVHDLLESYCIGPLDVLTSVVLTILPFALLRRLRINAKEKTALVLIFSLGLLCICAAILRWVVLLEISTASIFILWSTLEQSCLIVVQSLMVLRPLLYQIFDFLGIDSLRQHGTMHQLSLDTRHFQFNVHDQALKKQRHPETSYTPDMGDTLDTVETSRDLMKCNEFNSPGPLLLCSSLTTSKSDTIIRKHEHELELGITTSKTTAAASRSVVQNEQPCSHILKNMSRKEVLHHKCIKANIGRKKIRPRHSIKAKLIGAIPSIRKEPLHKIRHASTFSKFMPEAHNISDNRITLRLVP